MDYKRNACKILIMKPEALRLLGRASCTWEDSIKMGAKETGWEGVNWIHVAQIRDQWRAVVNTAMNIWNAGN